MMNMHFLINLFLSITYAILIGIAAYSLILLIAEIVQYHRQEDYYGK